MILKIKDYKDNKWWIYGEIVKMSNGLVSRKSQEDTEYTVRILPEQYDSDQALSIIARDKYDIETSFLLQDCVCFLCNDEGKTVDKIVC